MVCFRCRFLGVLALILPLMATSLAAQEKKYAHEFYHDFRGKPLHENIHVVGKPEADFIKEEAAGFRVTLPKTWIHEFGGVGCKTDFPITGDFEATGTFEILHADEPLKGFGVGASLRVQMGQPEAKGATFARVVRKGPNQILVWDHGPLKDGKFVGGVAKCTDKLLRLRLKRTGAAMHYQWAPGLVGDNFDEIRVEKDFGEGDVTAVRMNAFTGREPCNVDVRFLDLRIRYGGLVDAAVIGKNGMPIAHPNKPDNPVLPAAPQGSSWLLLAALLGAGVLVVLGAAVGIVLVLKRRTSAEPAGASASEPAFIEFRCTNCGKNLKAKAIAAGKKIKCAKCGLAMQIPAIDTSFTNKQIRLQ
jgi:DNA-directed RNA polymerase subunit RPC12/RpoP